MFKIVDDTIHLTRGDIATIEVSTLDEATKEPYKFKAGDVVRFKVFEKKDHSNVVLQKDVMLQEGETTVVDVSLDSKDTKIGDIINKPKEYGYEVELNPDTAPQTIIGYDDEEGVKVLRLYPEGGDYVER